MRAFYCLWLQVVALVTCFKLHIAHISAISWNVVIYTLWTASVCGRIFYSHKLENELTCHQMHTVYVFSKRLERTPLYTLAILLVMSLSLSLFFSLCKLWSLFRFNKCTQLLYTVRERKAHTWRRKKAICQDWVLFGHLSTHSYSRDGERALFHKWGVIFSSQLRWLVRQTLYHVYMRGEKVSVSVAVVMVVVVDARGWGWAARAWEKKPEEEEEGEREREKASGSGKCDWHGERRRRREERRRQWERREGEREWVGLSVRGRQRQLIALVRLRSYPFVMLIKRAAAINLLLKLSTRSLGLVLLW